MDQSARSETLRIEAPQPGERAALDSLILRSKAHWGYDDAMMEIMARWLGLAPEAIGEDRVRVARLGAITAGVAQIGAVSGGGCELDLLFIDPQSIGTGVGRHLYAWATETARRRGAQRMTILSDPFARGFYEAMGARYLGDRPSEAVPGRFLPRLVHELTR
ncbi:N-acetyltransferase [Marinicauda algicola]|uniref:N-acetyltransferase n=1 Tax=Marinicauda algicola TaxID=2029849 RepID=A0A4S2H3N7_9PROT|nr:GNAT family N-acetyltransferase [Marinicauda algicola]TGY90235.1 N-acetyltransferase [Marinicauda algicola]